MNIFEFNPEITVGDILTSVSVFVSICALLFAWFKDRQLKKRELAERVRKSIGITIAKLERWKDLSLQIYNDIQPLISDTDKHLLDNREVIKTRDYFWRGLVAQRADIVKRISDEEIEIAYIELYGYLPQIPELYSKAVALLNEIDIMSFGTLKKMAQMGIMQFRNEVSVIESSQLGNTLRAISSSIKAINSEHLEKTINLYRTEMFKIILASDNKIVSKKFKLNKPDDLYPVVTDLDKIFDDLEERYKELYV